MKMKKIGALAMTAMLGASVLTGCGGENASSASAAQNTGAGVTAKADSADKAVATETQKVELKIWVPEEEVGITDQMVKDGKRF